MREALIANGSLELSLSTFESCEMEDRESPKLKSCDFPANEAMESEMNLHAQSAPPANESRRTIVTCGFSAKIAMEPEMNPCAQNAPPANESRESVEPCESEDQESQEPIEIRIDLRSFCINAMNALRSENNGYAPNAPSAGCSR